MYLCVASTLEGNSHLTLTTPAPLSFIQKAMARSLQRGPSFTKVLFPLFTLIALSALYNFRVLLNLQGYTDSIQEKYDASFGVPVSGGGLQNSHPHIYKWEDLKQVYQEGHGTFFFGPHSHQIDIPADAKYEPVL